jgi:hypothetical protein
MRKWLARLAFSFILVATVLAWEAYQAQTGRRGPDVPPWRIGAYYLAAAALFAAGLWGVRTRHQLLEEQRDRDDPRR